MKSMGMWLGALVWAAAFAAGVRAEAPGQKGAEYIGGAKCKMCHMKQHKTWEAMKHAKAMDSLQGDEKKNADCLSCHTTGFEKGGFGMAKAAEENEKFLNVQCEACHGPGSLHMKAPKAEKKDAITLKGDCTMCHNPHVNKGEEAKMKRGG